MEHQTKPINSGGGNDLLKIIAILAMIIDHLGAVFFPQLVIFRVVGRVAFPIFAAGIAEGYYYTSSLKKYVLRLVIFGLVAQAPYMMLFRAFKLNILFALAISLIFIYLCDRKKYFLVAAVLIATYFLKISYGIYGILMSALFYFLKNNKKRLIAALIIITVGYSLYHNNFWQIFSFLGFALALYLPRDIIRIKLPRYFFYWFYPIHLIILLIIKQIL